MELLTVAETAKLLKVNPLTVRRYIADGRLRAVRVGRQVRVHKEAIEDLLSPIAPTRPGTGAHKLPEKGGGMAEAEQAVFRPMTDEQVRQALAAAAEARRVHAEQRARAGRQPVTPSWELLNEVRDQRTRDLG